MIDKLIIIIVEFMLIRPCRRLYSNWTQFQEWQIGIYALSLQNVHAFV